MKVDTIGVSIVIPCFNSAIFLPEALESVWEYKGKHKYEIIIVNDGSTDVKTLNLLNDLQSKGVKVLHQDNKGPAAARNKGVNNARFEYILFLDSDNKIRSNDFIDEGISILSTNERVGVVYGNAHFFGDVERNRDFKSKSFDMKAMLAQNYIDMCTMVRQEALNKVDGLDENRFIIGHEDWDLWLRIAKCGWQLHYCNKVLFDYRIRKNSLIEQTINSKSHEKVVNYIVSKHLDILPKYYLELYSDYGKLKYLAELKTIGRIKHFVKIYIKSILRKK